MLPLLRNALNFFRPINTVTELVERKKTFREITFWVEMNVWYIDRVIGSLWPTADQVVKDKRASCNGFAVLYYESLRLIGLAPHIVSMMWPDEEESDGKAHHALCIVAVNGNYYSLSSGCVSLLSEAASILEAVKEFKPDVLWAAEVDTKGSHVITIMSRI